MEGWPSLVYGASFENQRVSKAPWVQILPLPPFLNMKKIKLKPDKKVLEFLEYAAKEVAKMPEWKKGILEACSKATNDKDR